MMESRSPHSLSFIPHVSDQKANRTEKQTTPTNRAGDSEKFAKPMELPFDGPITTIKCGVEHTFALSEEKVYAWGSCLDGRLGINPTILSDASCISKPTSIESLYQKDIDRLECYNTHAFAWSSTTGEIYAWGYGGNGKLGFGHEESSEEPFLLECFYEAHKVGMHVISIGCGENHTLAVLTAGEDADSSISSDLSSQTKNTLFAWGNNEFGQLGYPSDKNITDPHKVDPVPWEGTIESTYAGQNYSAAITQNGELYTWGSGEFTRLGHGRVKQQKTPVAIKCLSNHQISKVALGSYHACAISSFGLIFSWGRGINGQLGHGSMGNEEIPKQIEALERVQIIDIDCGDIHTVALSAKGGVFTWGGGQYGQLGHGDLVRQTVPTRVNAFAESEVIKQISCGKKHTVALNQIGGVFVWGSNDCGQLGVESRTHLAKMKVTGNSSNDLTQTTPTVRQIPVDGSHGMYSPNNEIRYPNSRFDVSPSRLTKSDNFPKHVSKSSSISRASAILQRDGVSPREGSSLIASTSMVDATDTLGQDMNNPRSPWGSQATRQEKREDGLFMTAAPAILDSETFKFSQQEVMEMWNENQTLKDASRRRNEVKANERQIMKEVETYTKSIDECDFDNYLSMRSESGGSLESLLAKLNITVDRTLAEAKSRLRSYQNINPELVEFGINQLERFAKLKQSINTYKNLNADTTGKLDQHRMSRHQNLTERHQSSSKFNFDL